MWYDRSLSLWLDRELGAGAGQVLAGAARLAVVEGRLNDAESYVETGLECAERSGSRVDYPFLALGSAALAAARGDGDSARALFAMALCNGRRAGVALRPMIDGELAPLYRQSVGEQPTGLDETRALATPLEDLPTVIRELVRS